VRFFERDVVFDQLASTRGDGVCQRVEGITKRVMLPRVRCCAGGIDSMAAISFAMNCVANKVWSAGGRQSRRSSISVSGSPPGGGFSWRTGDAHVGDVCGIVEVGRWHVHIEGHQRGGVGDGVCGWLVCWKEGDVGTSGHREKSRWLNGA
jgi:hypothetical protein